MKENKVVTYNNNRIVLSHERRKKVTLDIYPKQHLLTYVRDGILKIKEGKEEQCFHRGEFVLLKKYTQVTITKTWCADGTKFSSFVFSFHEDLVQQALHQLNIKLIKLKTSFESIVAIETNPILKQFIQSLQLFFEEGVAMDDQLAKLKTTEALIGIIRNNEQLAYQLQNFSIKSKADLHQFMNFHFLENKKISDFARDSGRSISTFKKDFQSIYNTTPAKWLKQKRLEYAYQLLTTTNRKASDIYLESGFEDLAHFSKSFKSQFSINPSEIKSLTDK